MFGNNLHGLAYLGWFILAGLSIFHTEEIVSNSAFLQHSKYFER